MLRIPCPIVADDEPPEPTVFEDGAWDFFENGGLKDADGGVRLDVCDIMHAASRAAFVMPCGKEVAWPLTTLVMEYLLYHMDVAQFCESAVRAYSVAEHHFGLLLSDLTTRAPDHKGRWPLTYEFPASVAYVRLQPYDGSAMSAYAPADFQVNHRNARVWTSVTATWDHRVRFRWATHMPPRGGPEYDIALRVKALQVIVHLLLTDSYSISPRVEMTHMVYGDLQTMLNAHGVDVTGRMMFLLELCKLTWSNTCHLQTVFWLVHDKIRHAAPFERAMADIILRHPRLALQTVLANSTYDWLWLGSGSGCVWNGYSFENVRSMVFQLTERLDDRGCILLLEMFLLQVCVPGRPTPCDARPVRTP